MTNKFMINTKVKENLFMKLLLCVIKCVNVEFPYNIYYMCEIFFT